MDKSGQKSLESLTSDEEEDEEDEEDEEVSTQPGKYETDNDIKVKRPSKWTPVWPDFKCIDCFGCCFFFYILFGFDKKDDISSNATQLPVPSSTTVDQSIVSSTTMFNYTMDQPRRPTQMNIPLDSALSKKDSLVSSITVNDNNEEM